MCFHSDYCAYRFCQKLLLNYNPGSFITLMILQQQPILALQAIQTYAHILKITGIVISNPQLKC